MGRDDWTPKRGHGEHFAQEELDFIADGFRKRMTSKEVAQRLQCATRTINIYFAMFRAEGMQAKKRHASYYQAKPTADAHRKPISSSRYSPEMIRKMMGAR